MPHSIRPKRLTRPPRAELLALATLVSGVLMAGCGGSSPGPSGATADGAITSASSAASSGSTASGAYGSGPLAFAKCMRANGVPSFADPKAGGHGEIPVGNNPAAPAFNSAMTKCQKLVPDSGPPARPGSRTHPSAQTLAKLLKIARCMRQHGVPQFPDPQTSVPSNPAAAGISEITDFDDAILLFPATINMQAPAYRQALTACGAPPLGLPH